MRINLYSILFCSFAVFAIGSGIGRIPNAVAAPITRVEAVRSVPDEHGQRRGDRRDEAHEGEAGKVAPAPQLGADVERDHRAPEDEHLEGSGDGEEKRRHRGETAGQPARASRRSGTMSS